jgi:uncharacterized protein DUF4239
MTLLKEGLLILAAIGVPAVFGMLLVRRLLPAEFRDNNRQSAEPVWAIAGGAFGLLLGFLVVNLWSDLQAAQNAVQDEANDMVIIDRLADALPPPADHTELHALLEQYARLLVSDEWAAMGRHQSSAEADGALNALWRTYLQLDPAIGGTSVSYRESLHHLGELQDARNRRLSTAENRVPAALWVVLIGGVIMMIAMAWLTGSDNVSTHLLTTLVLAVSLASVLFLIRVFNNPFQGTVRADPGPIERVIERLGQE